jgi:2-succinyl-6-hydroxy-2,4-cyclohexadiene-1-carboxylate synthase
MVTPGGPLVLHFDVHGRADSNRRVVLVHGFTQTRTSWARVIDGLAAGHQVVSVDAPAHGLSDRYRVGLWEGARLLGEVGNQAAYVGYSMGGRLVLHLALAAPYLVRRVVLVGATAGLDEEHQRAARRAADDVLAAGLERDGIDAFLARWLDNPLFATLPNDAADLDGRRQNTSAGLASSLRLMGTGNQEPLWDRLPSLSMPALLIAGQRDEKFTALAHRLAAAWGGPARVAIVPDSGHSVHLEQPAAFLDLVVPFLDEDHPAAIPAASNTP